MRKNFSSFVKEMDAQGSRVHWRDIMVYFMLAAITILFAILTISFLQFVPAASFSVPAELSLGTICLAVSGILTVKIKQFKKDDRLIHYRKGMILLVSIGVLFCGCQFLGWQQLLHSVVTGSRNMMLVLLVAHLLHFAVGLFLAFYFMLPAFNIKTGADLYIWFLQPKRESFFRLSLLYWDFMGCLWLVLYAMMQLRVLL